jgi:hypothetical protein
MRKLAFRRHGATGQPGNRATGQPGNKRRDSVSSNRLSFGARQNFSGLRHRFTNLPPHHSGARRNSTATRLHNSGARPAFPDLRPNDSGVRRSNSIARRISSDVRRNHSGVAKTIKNSLFSANFGKLTVINHQPSTIN